MGNPRCIGLAKILSMVGLLVLLSSTYYLRSEVLTLNKIGFSADQARADYEQEQLKENFPYEKDRYEVAKQNYETQMEHYREMLQLYRSDYDAYVQRIEDKYKPPQLPAKPQPPRPPEYTQKLMQINAEFRGRKHHYFEATGALNWVALGAAICLVGGLLYLIMFDAAQGRLIYFATLVLSFVFMIGPSFHSIMSAIVGFMKAPGVY
jgi:hypothetical protein